VIRPRWMNYAVTRKSSASFEIGNALFVIVIGETEMQTTKLVKSIFKLGVTFGILAFARFRCGCTK
jgi:hypothetical protein